MGGEKEKWEVRNGWWAEQKQCRHLHGQNFEINERVGCDQHMPEPRAIIYSLKKKRKRKKTLSTFRKKNVHKTDSTVEKRGLVGHTISRQPTREKAEELSPSGP